MLRHLARYLTALIAIGALGQTCAVPALALSTAQEIAQGKAESAEVDAHSIKITDPFLVAWVNSIGGQLAQHRQRRDINFTFTILATPDINAFAMKGGFIHVDMGLLNFVSSDDDLAATMGHEMGHVELRHVVKSSNQGTIIGILTALVSIVSPVAGVLGDIGGEMATQKFSRLDELQADHYGMRLAAQTGFDPEAAVDVMAKLGAMDSGPESKADKAFIDHPVPQDRVAHLLGYPELDRPTDTALTAQAIHDQQEGRYSYAQAKLRKLKDASSPLVAEHVTQLDYALRESGALAAPDSRVMLVSIFPDDPRRKQASAALKVAQSNAQTALAQAKTDARIGAGELDNLEQQITRVSTAIQAEPQGSSQGPQPGGAGGASGRAMAALLAHLDADVSGTADAVSDVVSTAPGLIGPNQDALREMAGPFDDDAPLTPKYQALLAYYPSMTAGLNKSNDQLLDSIAQSRAAIAQGLIATQIMSNVMTPTAPDQYQGHGQGTASPRPPNIGPVLAAWDAALAKAQQASDEMYAAQTIGLSVETTLLDVESSPERYSAFAHALEARFPGQQAPSYAQATHLGIPAGEIACASWYAFDTHLQVSDVLANLKSSNQTCEDAALGHHLLGESMEIAEGLVYEDYVDTPQPIK